MVVRAGREFLAIPGPTTMPDEVLQAMHRPALDIYSEEMVQLTDGLLRDLSRLFATKGKSYIYIANGHGAWEAVLSNVLSRGDKILVLESGRFAVGWRPASWTQLVVTKTVALHSYSTRAGTACLWKSSNPSSKVRTTVRGGTWPPSASSEASTPAVMVVYPAPRR